jgi:hypothetical protein
MIYRGFIRSKYGIPKLLILVVVWLGIYYNACKNIYFLIMIPFWIIAIIKKSDLYVFPLLLVFVFFTNIINYSGHDYNKYVEWTGLPIELFFILSLICVFLLYWSFVVKNKNYDYVLPFLFLMNPSLRYMSSGVLRNLIAFTLWNLSELFIIVIPIIHVSSAVYFIGYYFIRDLIFDKLYLRTFYKYLTFFSLLSITLLCSFIFPSNFFRVITYFTKFDYILENFWNFRCWKYYVLVSSTIIPVYWINYRKINSWIVLYCFMFVYIYHFKFMIRMVYISWFSLTNIIISLSGNDFNKKYLYSLSLYYLTSVVP